MKGRRWFLVGLVVPLAFNSCGGEPSSAPRQDGTPHRSNHSSGGEQASKSGLDYLEAAYTAVTGRDEVAWAPKVALTYSGLPAGSIRDTEIDDASAWRRCPFEVHEYAARNCPVSALTDMEITSDAGARIVHDDVVPTQVGCDRSQAPAVPYERVVTVRPDRRHRNCVEDFAVTLYLDDADVVTAVNVVLSAP